MARKRDPELDLELPAEPLVAHLNEWIHDHRGCWPPVTNRSLADRAQIRHSTMNMMMAGEKTTVRLGTADKLLMATNGFLSAMYPMDNHDPIRTGTEITQ